MPIYAIDADDTESDLYDDEAIADPYQELRKVLLPEYQNLPPEAIEQVLKQNLGEDFSPEDAESFLRSLGQIGAAVLPIAATAVGTAVGGPVGGALGGAVGSLAGNALGAATAPRPPAPRPAPRPAPAPPRPQAASPRPQAAPARPAPQQAARPVTQPAPRPVAQPAARTIAQVAQRVVAPQFLGARQPQPRSVTAPQPRAVTAPQPAPTPGTGSPAATQLVSAILQPQVLQALLAMAIGSAARQSVQVGDIQVPTGAFANMLGVLGNQAAQQSPTLDLPISPVTPPDAGESMPAYLMDSEGNLIADPVLPEARATALFNLLQQANQEQFATEPVKQPADFGYPRTWQNRLDELYDAIELAEMYGEADYDVWEGC